MYRIRRRPGFTLIEMLIVVVVIGILAAIGVARFKDTKGKGYAAGLKSDLKNLTSLQESYFYFNNSYAPSLGALNFRSTTGVQITIAEASGAGWSAVATHPAAWPLTCAVYYGQAAPVSPAFNEGMINCQ
jgi:prepilin-type N-terminal cleavage/methylation domain-containing protein